MNHLGDTNKMVDTPRTETYVLNPLPQVVSAEWARQLERELNAANERIQRLQEAGDAMFIRSTRVGREIWTKAKEAKP